MDNTGAVMQQHRCSDVGYVFSVMEIGFICHRVEKNINVL